jgi:hypothetical protein
MGRGLAQMSITFFLSSTNRYSLWRGLIQMKRIMFFLSAINRYSVGRGLAQIKSIMFFLPVTNCYILSGEGVSTNEEDHVLPSRFKALLSGGGGLEQMSMIAYNTYCTRISPQPKSKSVILLRLQKHPLMLYQKRRADKESSMESTPHSWSLQWLADLCSYFSLSLRLCALFDECRSDKSLRHLPLEDLKVNKRQPRWVQ